MSNLALRGWMLVHKWTSIVSTAFLLMLCVTGLPLIFHDEIDAAIHPSNVLQGPPSSADGPGLLPLDTILATALANRPGEVPNYMAFGNDTPMMTVTTGPRPDAHADEMTLQLFDRSSGKFAGREEGGVMDVILKIHTDMYLGLAGMLFLGLMGLLFCVAVISGVMVYAPFMRRLDFGTLRTSRSRRVKWLDYHNLLGIVTLAWCSVVGLSGVINAIAEPLTAAWRASELADMTRAYAGKKALPPSAYGSLDKAMTAARAASPGSNPQFIAFPGSAFSTGHHYAVFMQGGTPLTERLLTPALIDAQSGVLTDIRPMPWYMQALALSRPLHFGDYGGLPLKLLWAALDIFTILILGSGLYLWLGRGRPAIDRRIGEALEDPCVVEAAGQ